MERVILSVDEVRHLGKLARIFLSEAEVATFQHQLTEVIDYNMHLLRELDVEDVAPTLQTSGLTNIWRDDRPQPSLDQSIALENAPAQELGQFVVKKVFGDGS